MHLRVSGIDKSLRGFPSLCASFSLILGRFVLKVLLYLGESMERSMTVSEAARRNQVTRQALYLAIKEGRLKTHMKEGRQRVFVSDLESFTKERYTRKRSRLDGELIFDDAKGTLSIAQASERYNIPEQKLYYAVRVGKLPSRRARAAWVLSVADVERYYEKCLREPVRNRWVYG